MDLLGDWSFCGFDGWSFRGFNGVLDFFLPVFFCPCIGEMKTVAWLDGYWMFRTSWFLGGGV